MDVPKGRIELALHVVEPEAPKEVMAELDDITADISKIDIDVESAATNEKDVNEQTEQDESEVELIDEDEDISGANMPAGPEDDDEDTSNAPDMRKYEDPQDFELHDGSSSSSSDSDDESLYESNSVGPQLDETSSCSNNSDNTTEFETQDRREDRQSSAQGFHTKRTSKHTIPYNFKLMTQELTSGQSKFMENFDPERSNREKRKLTRKISTKKATLYDDTGLMGIAQLDICDCMSEECPGCHFPCPKCFSNKCGHECRQSRRWMYEEIYIEGTDLVIRNSAYYSVSTEEAASTTTTTTTASSNTSGTAST